MPGLYEDFGNYVSMFIANSTAANVAGTPKYNTVVASLNDLLTDLNRLSEKDASGKIPALTEKDYTGLLGRFEHLNTAIGDFQTTMTKLNADIIANAIGGLKNLVDKDLYELKKIPVDGKTDINALLAKARGESLDIPKGSAIQKMTGAQSQRIPLQYNDNGKMKQGFFTEEQIFDFARDEETLFGSGMVAIGAADQTSVSDRNIAATRIADLLGCNDLARSSRMKVELDGKIYNGVFMETAVGEDLCGKAPLERKAQFQEFEFSNQALRQLADIQVIDYLCLNVDRHAGNLFYQASEVNGKQIITGVMGIDHDDSFGTDSGWERDYLSRITVCSESMAARLGAMNKDMFLYAFKDLGLKEKEINAAWGRVEKFNEALRQNQIQIIKDDQFLEKKDDLTKAEGNIFRRITRKLSSVAQSCVDIKNSPEEYEKYKKDKEEHEIKAQYVNALPSSYLKKNLDYTTDRLARLKESLKNEKGFFSKKTENFERMMTALDSSIAAAENFRNGGLSEEAFRTGLSELNQKVSEYISYKKSNLKGSIAKNRMGFAVELRAFLDDALREEKTEAVREQKAAQKDNDEQIRKMNFKDLGKAEKENVNPAGGVKKSRFSKMIEESAQKQEAEALRDIPEQEEEPDSEVGSFNDSSEGKTILMNAIALDDIAEASGKADRTNMVNHSGKKAAPDRSGRKMGKG